MAGLKPFGVAVDQFTDEVQDGLMAQATEQMDPTQMAMMQIAAFQPSAKWAKDNPVAAMLMQAAKGQLIQQAQGMMGGNALNKGNTFTDKSGIFG